MKIRVTSAVPDASGYVVEFVSSIGVARGKWLSQATLPQADRDYNVEIDFIGVLGKSEISESGDVQMLAVDSTGMVTASGPVESVDDDGIWYLRLAPDALVMVESSGVPYAGQWVSVRVSYARVGLSPIGTG